MMIDYIPGIIHESFQKSNFYYMKHDFTFPVCNDIREKDATDYDVHYTYIDMLKEYVMVLKYFKPNPLSSAYVYIEGYYDSDGIYHTINQESRMTHEFIRINKQFLINVTKMYIRNEKIEKILN